MRYLTWSSGGQYLGLGSPRAMQLKVAAHPLPADAEYLTTGGRIHPLWTLATLDEYRKHLDAGDCDCAQEKFRELAGASS